MTLRKYDLVIYGATGFTGELTCEYIVELKEKDLKWAIAGRSLAKLEQTKQRLTTMDETLQNIDLIVADANNPDSLDSLLRDTMVVISTAGGIQKQEQQTTDAPPSPPSTLGPYGIHGTPLVEACLRQGTHYVDITGEHNWIKYLIDHHHEEAQNKNVLIVPSCGFDSVPSDLGTFMVVDHLRRKHDMDTADVKLSLMKVKGGVSGGTIQSMVQACCDKYLTASEYFDPYLLSTQRGQDKPYLPWFYKDHDFAGKWQAFFIMSVVNEKIVRRSWSLYADRGCSYGKLFKYRESSAMPFIPGLIYTCILMAVLPLASVFLKFNPIRRLVEKILPAGGTGPTREERSQGKFEFQLVATADTEPYDPVVRARGVVKGFRDPGYGETCRMLVESALSIVKSLDSLPGKQGGILTPASAFGQVLIDRLTSNGGMVFEVSDMP